MGQELRFGGWNEAERVAALQSYDILDTPPEPEFDDLVQLIARICEVPRAAIGLVDDKRQWFKAEVGLGLNEVPLPVSVCDDIILQRGLTIIPDAREDSRLASHPLVIGPPHIRFYAGVLLETSEGVPLGTLCVLDDDVRDLTEKQRFALRTIAAQVMSLLELRRALKQRDRALEARQHAESRQNLLTRELHHRVKNTLATVQAVANSTSRSASDVTQFQRELRDRIASLARTHGIITADNEQSALLHELLQGELGPHGEAGSHRYKLEGPEVRLRSEQAIPLGMAIHELTSNSAKFGSLSASRGGVHVRWHVAAHGGAEKLHLDWIEHGGPKVQHPEHRGFGSRVLDKVLHAQTGARVVTHHHPDGLHVEIELPLR
jgi:two-component sensor histidine kinase